MPKIRQEISLTNAIITSSSSNVVLLDANNYSHGIFYFEIVGKVASGTMTVSLRRLGTTTDDATLSFTETSYTRKRTASFVPPTNATSYFIFMSGGTTPSVSAGKIIILQTIEIEKNGATQITCEIGNQELSKNNTTPSPLLSPKYWNFNTSNFSNSFLDFSAEVVWTHSNSMGTCTITLQVDDGSFANWTTAANIVNGVVGGGGVVRTRVSFTPTNNRNYRISSFLNDNMYTYGIYSAKIIAVSYLSFSKFYTGSQVGTGRSYSGNVGNNGIASLSYSRIAVLWSNILRTLDFNGSNWGPAAGISNSTLYPGGICKLNSSTIALASNVSDVLETYTLGGTGWSRTGNSLSLSMNAEPLLTSLTSSRIALYNDTTGLVTYDWNGSDWSLVGNSLSVGIVSMSAMSSDIIAALNSSGSLNRYYFDGTNWGSTGNPAEEIFPNQLCSITYTGNDTVAVKYEGYFNNDLAFYCWDASNWGYRGSASIGITGGGSISFMDSGRIAWNPLSTTYAIEYSISSNYGKNDFQNENLILNTGDLGTGLQGRQTYYDTDEWDAGTGSVTYFHTIDSDNSSNSAKLVELPSTDITDSTITGSNIQISAPLNIIDNSNVDTNVINTTGIVSASRITTNYSFSYSNRIPRLSGTIGHPFMF